jgi:hypothetical protein
MASEEHFWNSSQLSCEHCGYNQFAASADLKCRVVDVYCRACYINIAVLKADDLTTNQWLDMLNKLEPDD